MINNCILENNWVCILYLVDLHLAASVLCKTWTKRWRLVSSSITWWSIFILKLPSLERLATLLNMSAISWVTKNCVSVFSLGFWQFWAMNLCIKESKSRQKSETYVFEAYFFFQEQFCAWRDLSSVTLVLITLYDWCLSLCLVKAHHVVQYDFC